MKLYERFADRGYHTSIVTTFGIDFDAYENAALSRLQSNDCRNNILITDQRMLTLALDGGSALPRQAGRSYSVFGSHAKGVFHPKIILQLGRRSGRLIIGSANMTASGLAGNLEITGHVSCGVERNGEMRIVAAAWQYLSGFLDTERQDVSQHTNWMLARTPWLEDIQPANEPVQLIDGSRAEFIFPRPNAGIAKQFIDLIGGDKVRQLLIISPYWDEDLSALNYLIEKIGPKVTNLLIEPERRLFPAKAMEKSKNIHLIDFSSFKEGRFVHAKFILAQTENADHVLYGSANCTTAALGNEKYKGSNEEACLYRRLPKNSVLSSLNLEQFLLDSLKIDPREIKPVILQTDIELEQANIKYPGRFECNFETLIWYPASSINSDNSTIELLSIKGQILACTMDKISRNAANILFRISGLTERPGFARIKFSDGAISAPAIISLVDALRSVIREPRSKRNESLLSRLEDDDTEETLLNLLEIMSDLETPENNSDQDDELVKRRQKLKNDNDEEQTDSKVLDYESFIAGRNVPKNASSSIGNSLAGSDLSSIRGFLNRFFSIESHEDELIEESETGDFSKAFDLGDEAQLEEFDPDFVQGNQTQINEEQPVHLDEESKLQALRQRKADKEYIVTSVTHFNKKMSARAKSGKLDSSDLLRLRAVLSVIATCAWNESDVKGKKASRSHVLSTASEFDSWPRLMGQILFSFFGGKNPSIQYLQIDKSFDQIPRDFIECWATCIWSIQACLLAIYSQKDLSSLRGFSTALVTQIYLRTGLHQREFLDPYFLSVMAGLNKRFANRLGLDVSKIILSHRDFVNKSQTQIIAAQG